MGKIEWTQKTWNPIIGCNKISPGCDHCYAERMANRIANMDNPASERYREVVGIDGKWSGNTYCDYEVMIEPYEWKKPRRIFIGSMTDIFLHSQSQNGKRDTANLFAVMAKCPQHVFQVLTKRPVEMKLFLDGAQFACEVGMFIWPFPNVWLGVTVCNQDEADFKIPILLETPAAVRYISIEPMLGPIDLVYIQTQYGIFNSLNGFGRADLKRLDWVIVGGETGPGARAMQPEWVERLWKDCHTNNTPFFFKSWGSFWNNKMISGWQDRYVVQNTPFHTYTQFPYAKNR